MNTETLSLPRSNRDYITPAALRQLIKASLGYNARQVTVSTGSSTRYLTITVRDAAVDVAKVRAAAATLDTWTIDNTDYCEGQSLHVVTTKEVDAIHGAPYVAEIKATIAKLGESHGLKLSNGKMLWQDDRNFWITANGGADRGCYIDGFSVRNGIEWAINALALQAHRVGA